MRLYQYGLSVAVIATASTASLVNPVEAATVGVELDLRPAYHSVHGVREDTSTSGIDLIGAKISATYTDGGTEDWEWVPMGRWRAGTDHVSSDMTIAYNWSGILMDATRRVQSFAIDLLGASAIWDAGRYSNYDQRNSPTTKIGYPFYIVDGLESDSGDVNAYYSDMVRIGDHSTGEDAFTNLFVDFSGLDEGGFLGSLRWGADTDVLAVAGDLTPVPAPLSALLLITGLGSMNLMRSRTKKRTPSTL